MKIAEAFLFKLTILFRVYKILLKINLCIYFRPIELSYSRNHFDWVYIIVIYILLVLNSHKKHIYWQWSTSIISFTKLIFSKFAINVYPLKCIDFEHFRVSGSTYTAQLLCSFTEAIRVASPFDNFSFKFDRLSIHVLKLFMEIDVK